MAGRNQGCGSCAPCSPLSPIRPACSPTGAARSNGCSCGLRLAAWRTVWGAQKANPVYANRYRHLTTREHNKLTPTQAQTVIAAAILRQLHAVITTGRAWDPTVATHGTRHQRAHRVAA